MPENKITFGLENVHIAFEKETSTDGVPTWENPIHILGGVRWTPTAVGEEVVFYADNGAYWRLTVNNGYTGELEVANIIDIIKAELLGWLIDNNKALIEDANGTPKRFALMFQVEGDAHARRSVYYRCQVSSRPAKEQTSKTETITPNTDILAMSATPIKIGDIMVPRADLPAGSEAYDKFFDAVYMPVFTTPSTASKTSGGTA